MNCEEDVKKNEAGLNIKRTISYEKSETNHVLKDTQSESLQKDEEDGEKKEESEM